MMIVSSVNIVGASLLRISQKKHLKRRIKKIVIVIIAVIIIMGVLFGIRNLFNPSQDTVFAVLRNDGSKYIVDLSKACDSINTLKADWSIENQIVL